MEPFHPSIDLSTPFLRWVAWVPSVMRALERWGGFRSCKGDNILLCERVRGGPCICFGPRPSTSSIRFVSFSLSLSLFLFCIISDVFSYFQHLIMGRGICFHVTLYARHSIHWMSASLERVMVNQYNIRLTLASHLTVWWANRLLPSNILGHSDSTHTKGSNSERKRKTNEGRGKMYPNEVNK